MKLRVIVPAVALFLASVVVCLADNPNMGTWKLNEEKSKVAAGAPKNHTVVYEPAGDSIKVIVDGTDAAGAAVHHEWTGKFDGKDYPVTGDSASDSRAYTQVDTHTLKFSAKKGGKVVLTGEVVVSKDGKTRTVTTSGTAADGTKVTTSAVYDKQ